MKRFTWLTLTLLMLYTPNQVLAVCDITIDNVEAISPNDCGADNGRIIITASGTGTLEYSIDGGATWRTHNEFNALGLGDYNVSVRKDDGSCEVSYGSIVRLEGLPRADIARIRVEEISSCGLSDGSITIEAIGLYGDFEYSIDGGSSWQTSGVYLSLPAGTYNVRVRNADGTCPLSYNVPIELSEPYSTPIIWREDFETGYAENDVVAQDNNAPAGPDWTRDISATTLWSEGSSYFDVRPIILYSDFGMGLFYGSEVIWTSEVIDISAFDAVYASVEAASYFSSTDDYVRAYYKIDGGPETLFGELLGTSSVTRSILEIHDLSGNNLQIVVRTAANGWDFMFFDDVTVSAEIPDIINIASANPTDCGLNNGEITITADNGSGDYQYSIDGGMTWQASNTFSGLAAGNYNVSIRNVGSTCQVDNPTATELSAPTPPSINTVTPADPSNCDANDGAITVSAIGGTGSLEYSINGGASWQTANVFNGLAPGSYDVSVRNDNGTCQVDHATATVINALTPPNIDGITASDPSNCGVNDGSITITTSAGTGSFEYSIDGGGTWQTANLFTNLIPGSYNVAVRNDNGTCKVDQATATIINAAIPPSIDAVTPTDPTNCGLNDGSIAITASAGTGSFEYSIDGGITWQAANLFTNLAPGSYNVAVRNDNGTCKVDHSAVTLINALVPPSIDAVTPIEPTICGLNNGSIVITASSGTGSFEYSIDGGTTWYNTNSFTSLAPGEYDISVRNDNGGCKVNYDTSITLTSPSLPVIDHVDFTNPTICGAMDGSITITATGGNIEYSIDRGASWQANNTFTNLKAGTYAITVRTIAGTCEVSNDNDVTLSNLSSPIVTNVAVTAVNRCLPSLGSLTIAAEGGAGVYEYSVDGGSSWAKTPTFNDLAIGTYEIALRHQDGSCQYTYGQILVEDQTCTLEAIDDSFTLIEGNALLENVTTNDIVHDNAAITLVSTTQNGSLNLFEDGNFEYTPDEFYSGPDEFVYQICAGTFCVQASVSLSVESDLNIEVRDGFSPNGDGNNDIWIIEGIHNYPGNYVKVFDRWGTLIFKTIGYDNSENSWNGIAQGSFGSNDVPVGTYYYSIRLNNELKPITGYVSLYR